MLIPLRLSLSLTLLMAHREMGCLRLPVVWANVMPTWCLDNLRLLNGSTRWIMVVAYMLNNDIHLTHATHETDLFLTQFWLLILLDPLYLSRRLSLLKFQNELWAGSRLRDSANSMENVSTSRFSMIVSATSVDVYILDGSRCWTSSGRERTAGTQSRTSNKIPCAA